MFEEVPFRFSYSDFFSGSLEHKQYLLIQYGSWNHMHSFECLFLCFRSRRLFKLVFRRIVLIFGPLIIIDGQKLTEIGDFLKRCPKWTTEIKVISG